MADISAAEARTLLVRAFADDPLMAWFYPDDDVRPHACAAMWQWPAPEHGGGPEPEDGGEPEPERLPTLGGLMTALMGPERAARIGGAMSGLGGLRPETPHAYLHLLGVDPGCRGEGLGGRLLDQGVAAAHAGGLVACLDTMNAANLPFYEAHGLSVRHETRLPEGGPTVWSMATG